MIAHLLQSTIFAIAAAGLAFILRSNRAQVRYYLWLTASIKFLVPFLFLIGLGGHLGWSPAVPKIVATPPVSHAIAQVGAPITPVTAPSIRPVEFDWLAFTLVSFWLCGVLLIVSNRLRNWLHIRAALRAGAETNICSSIDIRRSPGLLEPGVVGLIRPVILIPQGIEESLTPEQFEAILAHELCHARRRDNLFGAVHMVVETLFWFHPFVWWIGARLLLERERACDEEVLRAGTHPETYADAILNVCKLCSESPLACVAGVSGAEVRTRIRGILSGPVAREIGLAKRAILIMAAAAAVGLPILIGAWNSNPPLSIQALSPSTQHFRKVSITHCTTYQRPTIRIDSEGHLALGCVTINGLIELAWAGSMPGLRHGEGASILGDDPAFAMTDRYNIDAQADPRSPIESMKGPMMQAMLEDRFGLKIHKETRAARMYSLIVAKSGAKLTPAKESACAPVGVSLNMPPPPPLPGGHPCRSNFFEGSYGVIAADGNTLAEFSTLLGNALRTTVIDKTGISGTYVFHLKYAVTETPSSFVTLYPPLPKLLEDRFGLKLEPFTGAGDSLAIDRVEKPALN